MADLLVLHRERPQAGRPTVIRREYRAIVDDAVIDRVRPHVWRIDATKGYVYTYIAGVRVFLHRFVMDTTVRLDHKDGNPLNNQRANLRPCSVSQNLANRRMKPRPCSQFKGVQPRGRRWEARIGVDMANIYLGTFDSDREAAIAYNEAARQYYGDFAQLNEMET